MKNKWSTQFKAAVGYLLLIALLIFSIRFIYGEMRALTTWDDYGLTLAKQRRITNGVVERLNQAEVIGQSLSAGSMEQYDTYRRRMRAVRQGIDSLRPLLTDSTQLLRLDTVQRLIVTKERNMRSLLDAIKEHDSDKLYRRHLTELIAEQDTVISQQKVSHKVVTESKLYTTVPKARKGFFKRVAEVFVPDRHDSVKVENVKMEEVTDTIAAGYNAADTVMSLLNDIRARVESVQQTTLADIDEKTRRLRINGLMLNQKVHQLLNDIELQEQLLNHNRELQQEVIRNNSAFTLMGVAVAAIVLAFLFFALVWRDVSRSNHYRRELEKSKRHAEELLALRENLMLTITHDIKSPTGSIQGYIDLLRRITTDERQRFYLDNMDGSASHLLNLVNSLLDYHRLDANKMEIDRITFVPAELFQSIAASFEPLAQRKGLTLHYTPDATLQSVYIGDPFRIRQVAENLLSNAIKFTKEGSVTLQAKVENRLLCFDVIDTGAGMTPDEQQTAFKEFTRLRNAQGQEGFGLGLAITYKLVHLMEGDVQIESAPGAGSRFSITLPLPRATHGVEEAYRKRTTHMLPLCSAPVHLLLVDDDRIQLELTKSMLAGYPVQITTCTHPDDALQLMQQHPFDALLTDIQMPAMNGFELLKAIRALPQPSARELLVIAVTARSEMTFEQIEPKGFAGLLHKPFTADEFCRTLGVVLQCTIQTTDLPQPAPKPQTQKLNFGALTAFSDDDVEAAATIIATFISETHENLKQFKEGCDERDVQVVSNLAHKMLPVMSMLSAREVANNLLWLEEKRRSTALTNDEWMRVEQLLKAIETIEQEAKSYLSSLAI